MTQRSDYWQIGVFLMIGLAALTIVYVVFKTFPADLLASILAGLLGWQVFKLCVAVRQHPNPAMMPLERKPTEFLSREHIETIPAPIAEAQLERLREIHRLGDG